MRYPSLVFLSSTLPFLPWLDVGWLSACTRRPPLYPGLSSENSKPPVDEQREGEREKEIIENEGRRTGKRRAVTSTRQSTTGERDEQYRVFRWTSLRRGNETATLLNTG